jgi:DNA-binding SARP family transcriptional activator/tetratricopeptide (TPR) repeat protein
MDGASGAGTPELEIRLLGPIEVERGGEPVALGGQKPRALFAALALEPGRVVSVDRLVEALWPGDPPETAAHAVQVYVSQLRKVLGPVIATRAPGYVLELEPERVDAHRFARLAQEGRAALEGAEAEAAEVALREALALWRGPALADFLYEPFAQTQIARLEELRTVVVEERIEADLALGRHVELVSELEALVHGERLRERPRAQLMLALYRSGRQADALAAYRDARQTLVEELGIDPGPELRELEAAILRQDDSLLLEEAPLARPAMQFRRLVTILFVDVVESMALAAALDPEALGTVLRRFFETVSAAIDRHGGKVEKYAGDAVMAAFGIPVSHEDDALRAARAALDVKAGIAALNEQLVREHGIGLEIRLGLETGEVVATPTDARQRLVTGEAVGIAAKLEQSASTDEIVVGELAGRLIDHAATLEPLSPLAIKGKREPVRPYRLLALSPVAPAFEARQDGALVGRKRELAALRRALKRAVDGSATRVALVSAPPGVGKSRLAAEFTRRAKGVTTLWGRCLSYGDGITYWPVREVLAEARASDERDAILAALEAETPPPAPEIAWLFRRFCEAIAAERPLVVVLDDVHWAEPTFLELVDHLAGKGDGPILVVCLARDELHETSPDFLGARGNVDRIELDALSADETEALVDGLGGTILESDQRARVVEAAEGNPLFLEQLLALALEGGLREQRVPETIQALLAARLDRLGPGERAVLERGAVIGKEFKADDVVALLDPDAASTADAHLDTLVGRGFVRAGGDGAFGFRHVLVQDAVYRAAPKRLRADLHERYADRLDLQLPDFADLDEFVGYHLEQAYRLRTELGEADRRTERLAEDGGRRLGEAGVRAIKRADMPASLALLRRATALTPSDNVRRGALLQDLGIVLEAAGEPDESIAAHESATEAARVTKDLATEVSARVELEHMRLPRTPGATADALLDATNVAIPVLEAAGDHRRLGRALLFKGWVYGGRRGRHAERLDAAEQALPHYRQSTWPVSTCVGEIANALYYGPTPVPEAVARCEELLATEVANQYGEANVGAFLGGLVAQEGDIDRARELIASARATYEDLGHGLAQGTFSGVLGDVELLADDLVAAETVLRWMCDEFAERRAYSRLASKAGDLAEALYRQERLDEAAEWVETAEKHSALDDLDARVLWMPVAAKVMARRGDFDAALSLGRDAVALAASGDALNRTAKAIVDMAEVLRLSGQDELARKELESALSLYERKVNAVGVSHVQGLLGVTTAA